MRQQTHQLECDAILFDLDGVLIDSTSCIVRHWQAWADMHDLDIDIILRSAHGVRMLETMRLVAPHLDIEKEAEQFTAREVADTDGVVVIAGASDVVGTLPDDAWAIVTSGGIAPATARLRHAGLPIPQIFVTADDVTHGKPDPEPYRVGAARLGLAPERCVVIEDSAAGVKAGKAAGMRVIGVLTTHSQEELLAQGADVVVERLTHIQIQESEQVASRLIVHFSGEGNPMKIERCTKSTFSVIGKEGSTDDGVEFIDQLWQDAHGHFQEVVALAKKDCDGNLVGIWGLMSDFSRQFDPWEDGFSKGLYLAGVEVNDDAIAPEGWTKWTIPAFEYLYVAVGDDRIKEFHTVLAYIEENDMELVAAGQDFSCPKEDGKPYMFFPVRKL